MNTLILATSYFPYVGGLEQAVYRTGKELQKLGYNAVVVTERKPWTLKSHEIIDNIPVYRLPFTAYDLTLKGRIVFPLMWLYTVGHLLRIIRHYNIQMVHLQGVSRNCPYGIYLKQLTRLPVVATVQGVEVEGIRRDISPSKLTQWQITWLHRMAQKFDMITSCSAYLGQTLLEIIPEAKTKLVPIHNGIDLCEFEPSSSSSDEIQSGFILSVGRLVPKKGFDTLLRAYAHLVQHLCDNGNSPLLVIAGDGSERPELEKLASHLGIEHRIRWQGMITDRQKLVSFYHNAAFCVIPSRQEPFGIVCLEVLAARKPLVATAVGGIPEIVRNEVDGLLVPADDPTAMAIAMQRILTGNHQLRQPDQLRERAAEFAWDIITQRYLTVYQRAITLQP